MNVLDKDAVVNTMPLDKKVLIEASAGTGKTFTTGLIVLRLLLEKFTNKEKLLTIEKIVLITFTKAATAELRKETSIKIAQACDKWEKYYEWKENPEKDDSLTAIVRNAIEKEPQKAQIKKANLLDAMSRIDEMPVFTIHGFCERLLSEFAFETGNFEKKEIITNQSEIIDVIIADFWRTQIENLSDEEMAALPQNFSPQVLKTGINNVLNFPNAKKVYEDKSRIIENYFKKKKEAEKKGLEENIEIKYNKDGKIAKQQTDKYPLFQEYNICFEEYCKIGNVENNSVAKLQYKLATELLNALQKEKEIMKIRGFEDLIENVYGVIFQKREGQRYGETKTAKTLLNAVQKKYGAILVDEFQDTDKMQYEIFDYLFKGKPFFMIGDPKQAIYRFRGGDIYAYLSAKKEVENTGISYTLKENFRSQERLLTSLNKIFDTDNPFKNNEILYEQVASGTSLKELTINGKPQKPLVILNLEYNNKDDLKPVKSEIVREINRLLHNTRTEIYDKNIEGMRRIAAKDIAVLTKTNAEAKEYAKVLKENEARTIPAVIRRCDSVFQSETADFVMRLLTAFIHSQKESRVKAALMEAKELSADDIKPFAESFEVWKKYGVMRAMDSYFDAKGLWGQILNTENGERKVTNLRQLMGILNEEECLFGRVPERTLRRFATLVQKSVGEEFEEKLETDDNAVQIMTVHTSKGLQFPVVFVTDITASAEKPGLSIYERNPPIYHKGEEIFIEYEISNRTADRDNAKAKENKEYTEETARNFYVAVTRPIYRLYVINAYKKEYKKDNIVSAGQEICAKIREDKNILATNGFFDIEYPKNSDVETKEEIEKQPQICSPKRLLKNFYIKPAWTRTSFSGISKNLRHADYISDSRRGKPEIPTGKRMGTLLHGIFENLDFRANSEKIKDIVENRLGGFKEFSKDDAEGENRKLWVKNKVDLILKKTLKDAGKLCEIDPDKKAAELGFLMNCEKVDLQKIKKIMGEKIPDVFEKKMFDNYVKGFIDLIFKNKDEKYYILDWKSNNCNGDFSEKRISEEMVKHGYHLQYYIYAVALKRWLEKTQERLDFKKHFGGVFYIFIRGVNNENDDGIFYADGENLVCDIEKLDSVLMEKE